MLCHYCNYEVESFDTCVFCESIQMDETRRRFESLEERLAMTRDEMYSIWQYLLQRENDKVTVATDALKELRQANKRSSPKRRKKRTARKH